MQGIHASAGCVRQGRRQLRLEGRGHVRTVASAAAAPPAHVRTKQERAGLDKGRGALSTWPASSERESGARALRRQEERPPPSRPEGGRADQPGSTSGTLPTGLSVTWLGTSSGNPTQERNVSCTVVQTRDCTVIVDCGEGSHRQMRQAGIDAAAVSGIFITHLHGDHCFGLATTLKMIDAAKAARAGATGVGRQGGDGEAPVVHVCGPPGLGELLRAGLLLTGEQLSIDVVVSELVLDGMHAHGPRAMSAHGATTHMGAGASTVATTPAEWASASTSGDGSAGPEGHVARLLIQRLASRSVFDDAELTHAAYATRDRVRDLPVIWRPPRHWDQSPSTRSQAPPEVAADGADARRPGGAAEPDFSGWNYVAQTGRFWELPGGGGGLRVQAAQLQHRVPCWGYTFRERGAAPSRRKVVLLGDTVDSAAMAPLALHCDVIAHEATFMRGMEDKCRVAQHSTGYAAGAFADAVRAKQLVLTHFSARYRMGPPAGMAGGRGRGRGRSGMRGRGGRAGAVAQGSRGAGAEWRALGDDEVADEAEQARAIGALVAEARRFYRGGPICAAQDFNVLHVPLAAPAEGA